MSGFDFNTNSSVAEIQKPNTELVTNAEKDVRIIKEVWKEVKELPSNSLSYPKGTKIYFTPIKTKEMQVLNDSDLSNLALFEHTLENIKVEGGMPKENITFSDFTWVGLLRKMYAQEDVLCSFTNQCQQCGFVNTYEFEFSDLEFDSPKEMKYPARFKLGNYLVDWGVLTIGNVLDMLRNDVSDFINASACCVKDIRLSEGGESIYSYELAKELVSNSWGKEREMMEYVDNLYFHGLKDKDFKCKNPDFQEKILDNGEVEKIPCGHIQKESLCSPSALIFPKFRPSESFRSEISFG